MKSLSHLCIFLIGASLVFGAGAPPAKRPREVARPGGPAPDFALGTGDGKQTVRLSDFRGRKPVVLIFGSHSCPPFRDIYPALERLHEVHGERVAFFYVYIREAHPEDGAKSPRNERDGVVIHEPKTMAERMKIAAQSCERLDTRIPVLVDTMDNATERAYAAWPARIYVVDVNGRVAVQGASGTVGLAPAARAAESWLKAYATISAAGAGIVK